MLSTLKKHTPQPFKRAYWQIRHLLREGQDYVQENKVLHDASQMVQSHAQRHPGQKVFIDLGFNRGAVTKHMAKNLGHDFNIVGFEVNKPLFEDVANTIMKRYSNVQLHFAAASDHDGVVNFFEHGPQSGLFPAQGTTVVDGLWTKDIVTEPQEIPCFDFSVWLKSLQEQHTKQSSGLEVMPYIALKMDIEGAEYPVLEKMIKDGTISAVSDLIVEFHAHAFDADKKPEMQKREQKIREALAQEPNVHVLEWI